ncbi:MULTISPECIES: hypothetical protein [Methylococcus]|uniref:Uncharacterized protein n=1 Tax=Methylococcus capsulatus TaxID=414 RepID=A0ABZ2F617_METCP|nr:MULTISPECIES: hypothetical protein [Methylococcus]
MAAPDIRPKGALSRGADFFAASWFVEIDLHRRVDQKSVSALKREKISPYQGSVDPCRHVSPQRLQAVWPEFRQQPGLGLLPERVSLPKDGEALCHDRGPSDPAVRARCHGDESLLFQQVQIVGQCGPITTAISASRVTATGPAIFAATGREN